MRLVKIGSIPVRATDDKYDKYSKTEGMYSGRSVFSSLLKDLTNQIENANNQMRNLKVMQSMHNNIINNVMNNKKSKSKPKEESKLRTKL